MVEISKPEFEQLTRELNQAKFTGDRQQLLRQLYRLQQNDHSDHAEPQESGSEKDGN